MHLGQIVLSRIYNNDAKAIARVVLFDKVKKSAPPPQAVLKTHVSTKGNEMKVYFYATMDHIGMVACEAEPDALDRADAFANDELQRRWDEKHPNSHCWPLTMSVQISEAKFLNWSNQISALPAHRNPLKICGEGFNGWAFDYLETKKEKGDASAASSNN